MIKGLILILVVLKLTKSQHETIKEIKCNLVPVDNIKNNSILCSLAHVPLLTNDSIKLNPLIQLDESKNLIWIDSNQPVNTRWSDLCPSSHSICSNDCDSTGICKLTLTNSNNEKFEINLFDNMNKDTENPEFTNDLKFINVTLDSENFIYDNEGSFEVVLIDSTIRLDPYRSKPNRVLNEFELEQINTQTGEFSYLSDKINCKLSTIGSDVFTLRYDIENEKLNLKLINKIGDIESNNCFLYLIRIKRKNSIQSFKIQSSAILLVNINENIYDRPVFEKQVYNFRISENSPMENVVIGKVKAINLNTKNQNSEIKYRIVPIVTFENDYEASSNDALPIQIDQYTGVITQKLNIDREKYQNTKNQFDGLITFNVESSYESNLYSYCKVNVFIEDVNDNEPIARIRPISNFGSPQQSSNLIVSENTLMNQIIAYVGVQDQDAGENGTIKSIELNMLNYKKPSNSIIKQRKLKLNKLKEYSKLSINHTNLYADLIKDFETDLELSNQVPQVPFKLNKIGDKLFTIQLIQKLKFKFVESYSIEMKIQDNGTRPQLESKMIVNLNVNQENIFKPIFLNQVDTISILENSFAGQQIFKFDALDLDDGINGEIRYKIINGPDSNFYLNETSGELKLLRGINREILTSDSLELIVMATDQTKTQSKQFNSKFKLTIKLIDVNDHKPTFESNKFQFTLDFNKHVNKEKFVKISSSIEITDLDTFETNSANYSDFDLNTLSNEDNSNFRFSDLTCRQTLNLSFVLINHSIKPELNPFVILIENQQDLVINYVNCRLSIWIDSEKLNKFLSSQSKLAELNQILFKFFIKASDFGDKLYQDDFISISEFSIEINLNKKMSNQNHQQLIHLNLNKDKSAQILNSNNQMELKSAFKLNFENNNLMKLNNFTNKFEVKNKNHLSANVQLEEGVYLIDLYQYNITSHQRYLNQIQLVCSDEQESKNHLKLLNNYKKSIQTILDNSQEYELNNKVKSLVINSPTFSGLLFKDRSTLSQKNQSILSILLNNKSTFMKLVFIITLMFLISSSLIICCIILTINKKLSKRKVQNFEKFDQINANKMLNVADESRKSLNESKANEVYDVIVDQTNLKTIKLNSNDKVDQYLIGLNINEVGLKTINNSLNPSPKSDFIELNSYSPTSLILSKNDNLDSHPVASSCTSDEGCYGSSSFSCDEETHLNNHQIQDMDRLNKIVSTITDLYSITDNNNVNPNSGTYV